VFCPDVRDLCDAADGEQKLFESSWVGFSRISRVPIKLQKLEHLEPLVPRLEDYGNLLVVERGF